MKNRKKIIGAALGAALAGWLWWGNTALMVSEYPIFSARIPKQFDGFRIAQISDLHNARFGQGNDRLLSMLEKAEPDCIVMTGDLIDCRNTDLSVALSFAGRAARIAPCYYVTGNHEARIAELPELLDGLKTAGVTVLRNEALVLERERDTVALLGVDDPAFRSDYMVGDSEPVMTAALQELLAEDMGYTILLSHRPELFELYCRFGVDLVFSGHAHGGQFRLPFVGGVIAPNQWFFPAYDAGLFVNEKTSMIVSRGLGPSIIPLRVGNRPEIVVAELHTQEG